MLLNGISQICENCYEEDCKGYIWLLSQERDCLFEEDVEILEVNKDISFINPFSEKNNTVNIETVKPECPLHKKGKCKIHNKRPLVCRMYPLGLNTEKGAIYLVLHLDCLYSKIKMKDIEFLNRSINLISDLNPCLLGYIVETYRRVDQISKFPDGPNNYMRLCAI